MEECAEMTVSRAAGMRDWIVVAGLGILLALAPGAGGAHAAESGHGAGGHAAPGGGEAAPMLMVSTAPAGLKPGQPVRLDLMIHEPSGAVVTRFDTVHEKMLHLIIVRDGLDRFAHIHPDVGPSGSITATFTFPTAGRYLLYADYQPTGGGPSVAMAELTVPGDPPPKPALVPDAPGRVAGDGLVADIGVANAAAGRTATITFALSDAAGKPVADLQPYLGAMGHLVVLGADGTPYVHSHPLEGWSPGAAVAFETHFPAPGLYKGWGQFRRRDTVLTVPFVVRVP